MGTFSTTEPISAMTTVTSNTRPYWFFLSIDSTINDYLITSYNNPESERLYVFNIGTALLSFSTPLNDMVPPKLRGEIYLKMTAIFDEPSQSLGIFSITKSGKLVKSNFTSMLSTKSLLFLGESFEIKAVEFLQKVDYALICLRSGNCAVFDYVRLKEDSPTQGTRFVNVGTGFSKISTQEHQKFFAVSYPDTKQISFYPLYEAFCDDWYHLATECMPWDTFEVTKCLPNAYIEDDGLSCTCKEGYVLNRSKRECTKCPSNILTNNCSISSAQWPYNSIGPQECQDRRASLVDGECVCNNGYL